MQWLGYFELTIVILSIFYGTTMNAGFIGSFYVDRHLKEIGTAYLTALGFADLSITLIVMPICAFLMIQEQNLTEDLCSILQLFTEISTNSYSLLTMFVATDNYFRAHPERRLNSVFKSIPTSIAIPTVVLISTIIEIVGIYSKLNFDFCNIEEHGDIHFRIALNICVHFIPAVFSLFALVSAARKARIPSREIIVRKMTLADLNIITYVLYILCWIPWIFTIYLYPGMGGCFYNYILWLGMIRSAIGNSLYIIFNKYFRRGFTGIFKCIYCRTSLGSIGLPPQDTNSEISLNTIRPRRLVKKSESF